MQGDASPLQGQAFGESGSRRVGAGAEQCGKETLAPPRVEEPHAAMPLSLAVLGSECRRKETFSSSRRKPLLVELAISCHISVHALY
jgi:hypothetical protein